METRVYAIKETEDVHEISNEDFMNQAEDLGYVWSLSGFQNVLNCEGSESLNTTKYPNFFKNLHFRFIDIEKNTNTPSMDKIQDLLDKADEIKNGGK